MSDTAMLSAAVLGPKEYVWEGAWVREDVQAGLASIGVDAPSFVDPEDYVRLYKAMEQGDIGALVVANCDPDNDEVWPLDNDMKSAVHVAAMLKIPVFLGREPAPDELTFSNGVTPEITTSGLGAGLIAVKDRLTRGD